MAYGSGDDIRELYEDIEKPKRALDLCKAENKLQRKTIDSLNELVNLLNERDKNDRHEKN